MYKNIKNINTAENFKELIELIQIYRNGNQAISNK
jgi:hypothetical protein